MLLSKVQAEGVAKAFSELNNIGAVMLGSIKIGPYLTFTAWSDGDFSVTNAIAEISDNETYRSQSEFFAAYGLI